MARKAGSSSSIAIPLATLVAKLPASQTVKVSKGWFDAAQELFGDFGITEGDAPTDATPAATPAARPTVTVD